MEQGTATKPGAEETKSDGEQTIEAPAAEPGAGQLRWRSTCPW